VYSVQGMYISPRVGNIFIAIDCPHIKCLPCSPLLTDRHHVFTRSKTRTNQRSQRMQIYGTRGLVCCYFGSMSSVDHTANAFHNLSISHSSIRPQLSRSIILNQLHINPKDGIVSPFHILFLSQEGSTRVILEFQLPS
jgi:hypothetical protein